MHFVFKYVMSDYIYHQVNSMKKYMLQEINFLNKYFDGEYFLSNDGEYSKFTKNNYVMKRERDKKKM